MGEEIQTQPPRMHRGCREAVVEQKGRFLVVVNWKRLQTGLPANGRKGVGGFQELTLNRLTSSRRHPACAPSSSLDDASSSLPAAVCSVMCEMP